MFTEITQIIPRLPPPFCGVADYAFALKRTWDSMGIAPSSTIVTGREWQQQNSRNEPRTSGLTRKARVHGNVPAASALILHYSGYGYANRGAPLWLATSLRAFRESHPESRLITMFHEVAANGPVSTSAFWMRPLQKLVASRLMQISDFCLTNCEANADVLRNLGAGTNRDVSILPVFSNFGELKSVPPFPTRKSRLVLFSSNLGGRTPDSAFWNALATTVTAWNIDEVSVIGKRLSAVPALRFQLTQQGFLDSRDVSEHLAESRFGYAFHGPLLLGKSGIFASFAAHGVVPLIPGNAESLPDGLIAGIHFLPAESVPCSPSDTMAMQKVSRCVFEWYQPHRRSVTAKFYSNLFRECCSTEDA